jgi:polyferredoxin
MTDEATHAPVGRELDDFGSENDVDLPDVLTIRPPKGGRIHPWRRRGQIALSLLFLLAPFLDLLRFDVAGGRLILLRTAFGVQELGPIYLALLLGTLAVFAGALLYGRLYCGWLCPQTTLSEAAGALERVIRRKKDAPGWRVAVAKIAVVALSGLVAASLVSYFLDPSDRLSPPAPAWIVFAIMTAIIAADLLLLRHRFCLGICPYGILQSIIQDRRTLGVSLDLDLTSICLHCKSCVRSCFMGIDIRVASFHPHCINCGDCIDAINLSHAKIGRPQVTGFRYGPGPASTWPRWLRAIGIHDVRRAAFALVFLILCGVLAASLTSRSGLDGRLSPRFDLGPSTSATTVETHYRLTLTNRLDRDVTLALTPEGLPGLRVVAPIGPVVMAIGQRVEVDLLLSAPRGDASVGSHVITVRCADGEDGIDFETRFFVPDREEK